MTETDAEKNERKLRELAASGLSAEASWAVREIDKLRGRPVEEFWAVWLPANRAATFDVERYYYAVDADGELGIFDTDVDHKDQEVARFAAGQWAGVVRTGALASEAPMGKAKK